MCVMRFEMLVSLSEERSANVSGIETDEARGASDGANGAAGTKLLKRSIGDEL